MILQREAAACTHRVLLHRVALTPHIRCNDGQLRNGVTTIRCQSTTLDSPSTPPLLSKSIKNSPLLQDVDENGVLTLTLNRPKQRNALNKELLEMLPTALTDAAATASTGIADPIREENHPPIMVVVTRSEGPVFCSGHDLKELISFQNDDVDPNEESCEEIRNLFQTCSLAMQLLQSIPQPTICAVHGLATAAGCQLVASCDTVVASPQASFQTARVSIGLFCVIRQQSLVRAIGMKRSLDMLYTGRFITAQEAYDFGLVSRVVENPHRGAADIARIIATERSAAAMSMGKQVFYHQLDARDSKEAYSIASQAMEDNMQLLDASIGIHSFLQKSKPAWKNK
jgi:enoyl-CoA hydratase/carnithine racemase